MHDLLSNTSDEGWLTIITALMGRLEPVPTLGAIGRSFLFRIGHEECLPFREYIHVRASGKSNCCLGATVEHDHQGQRLSTVAAGDVELVGTCTSRIGIDSIDKLST